MLLQLLINNTAKVASCWFFIKGVPLATEPSISLIILPLMRILQRNLKRTTDTHYRHTPQTHTTDTHYRHTPQTHTKDTHHRHTLQTHHRHTPQTHTTDTHHRHTPKTHTTDIHYRHTLQTHTTDTHYRHTLQTHSSSFLTQLLFKFRCNIFIGVRIIKEMPVSVPSGTFYII